MRTIITYLVIGAIGFGAAWWYINKLANEKFEHMKALFEAEQVLLEKKLREDFARGTEEVLKNLELDKEKTDVLTDEFSKTDGANDLSGIRGEWLRGND